MNCPRCGATIPDASRACPACGATLDPPEREGMSKEAKYAIGGAIGCLALICLACTVLLVVLSVPDLIGLPLSIAAAALPAIIYVLAVIWLDRYEREPLSVLLGAFFWGSVVAIVIAVALELIGGFLLSAVAGAGIADLAVTVLGAPILEETSKGLALLILFFLLRNEFDDMLDGIVYGSVVGLGFAMTEDIFYLGGEYLRGGVGALAELFVMRTVLAGLAHALFTGTTGAGLGFARETTNSWLKVIVPLLAFFLAIGQHFVWNSVAVGTAVVLPEAASFLDRVMITIAMTVVLSGPVLLVLLTIVFLSWRREGSVIAEFLAGEVESGVVTPEEYGLVSSSWRRTRALLDVLFTQGLGHWYNLRKLFQAETELAFAKRRASRGERAGRGLLAHSEDYYRIQIRETRARLSAR